MSRKEFTIVANGPFLAKDVIEEACRNKEIIALDGAANKLVALGITPHIVLGDFDSVQPASLGITQTFSALTGNEKPYLSKKGFFIVPAKNQNLTDLSKAILYCDQQNAASITIICASGGRIDHQEGAFRALNGHYRVDRDIVIHTDEQSLRFAKDMTATIRGEPGDKIGILAYPHAWITTQGLEYEAENYELKFGFSENICNSLVANEAKISITGNALLVSPPDLSSQRVFAQLEQAKKYEILLQQALQYSS